MSTSPITQHARRSAGACLLLFAAALASTATHAAEWTTRHGLTSAQYQAEFENLRDQGYRLTAVSGYESDGARYAAIWKKTPGPLWTARHGLSSEQYQLEFNALSSQGYRLSYVNGYEVAGQARYAAIWEKTTGPAMRAYHGLTGQQYQSAVNSAEADGFSLSHISAFSIDGSPRFAAIFEKDFSLSHARHGLSAQEYQTLFVNMRNGGWRLKMVNGYRNGGSDQYAALWTKQSGPYMSARHGIPAAHYQAVSDNHRYQSYEPEFLQAFESNSGVRFNAVWTNSVFKGSDLELISQKARDYMTAKDLPGLSIAVMRGDRLVYAAGFGVADESTGLPMSPRNRLRVASVSKPITRVAIARLLAETALEPGTLVFGPGTLLGSSWSTPSNNPNIEDITIDHLVRHRAGFLRIDRNGNASDPMFAYAGDTQAGLISWALSQYPLGYTPGSPPVELTSTDTYSNFGYSLLGRVIEKQTGKTYEQYVREKLLIPAGAPDIVIGGDTLAERKPGEVVYYGSGAYSSVKPERFDSHGGWIARPMDLLRFMRHQNVLGESYFHGGRMSGTGASFRIGPGGNGLVAVSNTTASSGELDALMLDIDSSISTWPNVNLF
jgi:CubicO group peptidase (beta-lactamase class C family)